jgi:single-stranded DNA-binding protein
MKVSILANLSTDVTVTQSGATQIATFTVKERKSRKDENKPNNFWNVTVFGKQAETAAKYFKNGSPIFLTGSADWNEFTGNDGTAKRNVNVYADKLEFVPKDFSEQNAQTPPPATKPAPTPAAPAQEESASDELPF